MREKISGIPAGQYMPLQSQVMTEITIRPIRESEIEGFHASLDAVARERKYLGHLKAPSLDGPREWLRDGLERGVLRLVAVEGGQVVGWCDIEASPNEGFRHVGRLGMGVLKAYRGRGIGRRLLTASIKAAEEQGLEKVELDVYASNTAATKLYQKSGCHHEGGKLRARRLDDRYDDLISMALMLRDVDPDEQHQP